MEGSITPQTAPKPPAPSAPAAKPHPERRHDIYFREGNKGFSWSMPEGSITLTGDNRIRYTGERGVVEHGLSEIRSVRLQNSYAGKNGMLGLCHIVFRDGCQITVYGGDAKGLPDEERAPRYFAFVRDLHARFTNEDARTITFHAGLTEGRFIVLSVAVFAMAIIFGLIPLGILLYAPGWETLGVSAAAFTLLYGFYRMWDTNRPRYYSPDHLPDEMFP